MSTITFDTLEFTRKLRDDGFDEKQAETVIRVIADAQGTLVKCFGKIGLKSASER
jgi:hypothetical protein